jgi:glycosyltransferase involved in cell wall biosynthesis
MTTLRALERSAEVARSFPVLKQALRTLAASLGVRCTVETDVSDEGVVTAYRTAGIVACPSHFEGFGLTGIEALACGARVVASDIPPHREFLGEGASYHAPGDHVALAAALDVAHATPRPTPPPAALGALTIASATDRFVKALAPILGSAR